MAAALLAPLPAGVAAAAGSLPQPLFHFMDPAINESSGLAVSSYDDRVVFTHNDSGDAARFFAVDAGSGATLATYRLPGAANVDWEDMAAAPDETGRPSLWFADIGDNAGRRSQVSVYRVAEPRVDRGRRGLSATSAAPVRLELRYPDGPNDAEALLVDSRRGALYIATKSLSGRTRVYATRLPLSAPGVLQPVVTANFGLGAAVTGGAVSSAGDRLVLRGYTEAYVWPLGAGGVPAALRRAPERVRLPPLPQGESAAFRSDGALLVGSEGRHSAVYAVRLASSRPVVTPAGSAEPQATRPAPRDAPGVRPVGWVVLAVLMTVAGAWLYRRRGASSG